ncbi:MAG TPA: hypothetical protein VFA20_29250 [Myxococcaceae bacterium]|nr:hypothetical protein [Myxococcaceae bacterium]
MRYSTGQDIREGDEVWLEARAMPGMVVKVVLPGTLEAREWAAPDGGVLIEREELGLALATHPERDHNLVLIRRSR